MRKPLTKEEVESRVLDQIEHGYTIDPSGCWLWTGKLFCNGYGRIKGHHKDRTNYSGRAHIASYQIHKGAVPDGLFVCHTCDVRKCINPDHLWLGTNKDNQLDASAKGVFGSYWTEERRAEKSRMNSGAGNPMYGRKGELAPAYGRTGDRHPMFGKKHKEESKIRISESVKKTLSTKRKRS